MKPGKLNALMAAGTEVATGVALCLGLFTPVAAGALVALMVVAIVTVHRKNGFFVFNPGQGIEYCLVLAVASFAAGSLGAGRWSLDDAWHPIDALYRPATAMAVTALLGVGGAALQLAAVYRPPKG
jgi:putative oxidoreductase